MKCQKLISGKNKKDIISLSAEFDQNAAKINRSYLQGHSQLLGKYEYVLGPGPSNQTLCSKREWLMIFYKHFSKLMSRFQQFWQYTGQGDSVCK